jgi:hypothetical protein
MSGSQFPLGATSVTCVATDVAGNTATSRFTVTVNRAPPARITGSGYTTPETSAYRATFALDATGPYPPFTGSVKYYYARTRMNFASTAMSVVSVGSRSFFIAGTGTVNGVAGFRFALSAVVGPAPVMAITIYRPDGSVYYATDTLAVSGELSIVTLDQQGS